MSVTDSTTTSELVDRAKAITERELAIYAERTTGSQAATERARKVLPAGVPSSFQAYDPHPIVVKHASGSRMVDVDDNEYVDYDMGFGALFAGHMHPAVRRAVEAQLSDGTLYVTPCELDADVAELLGERYGFPLWRPTNSGTEATMDAIRLARGVTKRDKLVKVEGGYHGHHDEVMISNKPSLAEAGPADVPWSIPQSGGITQGTIDDVIVVPYNDAPALDRALSSGEVAAFIVEPVMENIGICLPEPGYLEAVREICTKHGTLLIFDEVKTGLTAGFGGATKQLGVEPDLVTLAKSIGGGFPVGAFGGKSEYMELIATGEVLHLGTYNGNPLVMAAAKATLTEACTRETIDAAITLNHRLVAACQEIIDRAGIPAHTVEFGAKGCITWSTEPVRNYRDYKATDFDLAFAQWMHGINRGILLPPGLDEQWLISVMHSEADAMRYADVFGEFVDELDGLTPPGIAVERHGCQTAAVALFCTDTFHDAHAADVAAAAPDLDVVLLRAGEEVERADLERITIAFFSNDAWPERAASFMKVALDAPNLAWLHSMSAGVDSPVFRMFTDRGVRLTTSSGASAPPIAGTVMLYLLALSRGLPGWMRAQAAHEWAPAPAPFAELDGQRIVVVGWGPIGQEVVRLAQAFRMHPVIVRRAAHGDEPCPVRPLDELSDAVRDAAAVVVALPLADGTRGIISSEVIAAMPSSAVFVNVGRGELVDQAELTDALASGRLAGAGLDVFDPEPLPADDPLWDLSNVIISPHTSGSSDGTGRRVAEIFLDNLARYVRDEPMRNEVDAT